MRNLPVDIEVGSIARRIIAEVAALDDEALTDDAVLGDMGIDSIALAAVAVVIHSELEAVAGMRLPSMDMQAVSGARSVGDLVQVTEQSVGRKACRTMAFGVANDADEGGW